MKLARCQIDRKQLFGTIPWQCRLQYHATAEGENNNVIEFQLHPSCTPHTTAAAPYESSEGATITTGGGRPIAPDLQPSARDQPASSDIEDRRWVSDSETSTNCPPSSCTCMPPDVCHLIISLKFVFRGTN